MSEPRKETHKPPSDAFANAVILLPVLMPWSEKVQLVKPCPALLKKKSPRPAQLNHTLCCLSSKTDSTHGNAVIRIKGEQQLTFIRIATDASVLVPRPQTTTPVYMDDTTEI